MKRIRKQLNIFDILRKNRAKTKNEKLWWKMWAKENIFVKDKRKIKL